MAEFDLKRLTVSRGKWVNELDLALALGEPSYCGNRGINTRRSKSRGICGACSLPHSDKRRVLRLRESREEQSNLPRNIEFVRQESARNPDGCQRRFAFAAVVRQIFASIRRRNV